jgi:hypothetical protein
MMTPKDGTWNLKVLMRKHEIVNSCFTDVDLLDEEYESLKRCRCELTDKISQR